MRPDAEEEKSEEIILIVLQMSSLPRRQSSDGLDENYVKEHLELKGTETDTTYLRVDHVYKGTH